MDLLARPHRRVLRGAGAITLLATPTDAAGSSRRSWPRSSKSLFWRDGATLVRASRSTADPLATPRASTRWKRRRLPGVEVGMSRLLSLALAALTLAPAPAHACWTGLAANTEGVELQFMGSLAGTWDPARMQSIATWLARIDAIAPDDLFINADRRRFTMLCGDCTPADNLRWDGELATLFDRIADHLDVDARTRRAALKLTAPAYTVQVASFADRADADSVALSLNQGEDGVTAHGFVEIGGHPSFNDSAHVVTVDRDGAPVHRVFVGAFLSRADAEAAQAEIHESAGLRGFVRTLV